MAAFISSIYSAPIKERREEREKEEEGEMVPACPSCVCRGRSLSLVHSSTECCLSKLKNSERTRHTQGHALALALFSKKLS